MAGQWGGYGINVGKKKATDKNKATTSSTKALPKPGTPGYKELQDGNNVGTKAGTQNNAPQFNPKTNQTVFQSATASDGGSPGSGVSAAGTPTGSGTTGDYSPTGFGKRFNPLSYGEMWENPDTVISEWFQSRGISPRGGAQATAMQWAPALGLHWMIESGDDAKQGTGAYLDYTGNKLNELMKPGGKTLGTEQILQALLNPQSDVLKEHLGNADLTPAAQVENMRSAMRYGLANQMPTPVLQAMLAKLDQMGRDFIGNRATDQAQGDAPFSGYVRSRDFFGY